MKRRQKLLNHRSQSMEKKGKLNLKRRDPDATLRERHHKQKDQEKVALRERRMAPKAENRLKLKS